MEGPSLMVQWLGLHTPRAGGPSSIPGQGTRSHMPQLRVHMLQQRLNIQSASTETQGSQMNKYFFKEKNNMSGQPVLNHWQFNF